jgi:hypothetical protein
MIASGFKKINFLNQTENFDYNILLSISNFTGYFEFGLSGSGENLSFNGQHGKLRDKNNNLMIGYVKDEPLDIQGKISLNKQSLSINNFLIYQNIDLTGYNFNHFYLNPINVNIDYSFSLTGKTTDFNLSLLNKKIKDFNITGADGTTFSTKTLTGLILNSSPDLEIKIFSGEVLNKSDYYSLGGFPTSFYNSGQYLIDTHTGEDALINDAFEARFYTNFGIIDKTIQISGDEIPLFFLFFNVLPQISGFPNLQTGSDLIFVNNPKNYYVSYGYVSGAQVQASLTYIQGLTGNVTGFLEATGAFSGYLSGLITGSGFLSTFITGTGITFSVYNEFLNSVEFSNETGFFAKKFFEATGYSQGNYYVKGFGSGSGIFLKDIYASGLQNFTYSGQVPYIGGINVIFNPQSMIGTGKDVNEIGQTIYPEGYLDYTDVANSIKILYTGFLTGVILDTGKYGLKTFFYDPQKTGKFVFESFIPGTGLKFKSFITGIVTPQFFVDLPFGYFQFIKNVTGIISGDARTFDDNSVYTGYKKLLECSESTGSRNYVVSTTINFTGEESIKVTGYAFLSPCTQAEIPSGFSIEFTGLGDKLYLIVDEDKCKINKIQADENIPKWLLIKPSGVFEILFKTGISGNNLPLYSDDLFFSQNSGKQYQLFADNSSGYFKNIIGDKCTNEGIWEQYFKTAVQVKENYSNFYLKNFNVNLISLEDNGRDYPSEVYFNVKNNNENYNFQLTQNNTVINSSPQRDLHLKLILSKKILDGYSGLYETSYFKSNNLFSFCTGLSIGDYRAKIKYLNVDKSPKIRSLCRIPIQIANILDKNIYNKLNIDFFTGSGQLSQDFYGFRYLGSGWHQQANIYYTKTGIYGHGFITGYTQVYRDMLYTPPYIDSQDNFTPDLRLIQAFNLALTGLNWSGYGVKNINIFTNRVSLSGVYKKDFLKYINDIYNTGKFIVNVFDYPDVSFWGKQKLWVEGSGISGIFYEDDGIFNKLEVHSLDVIEPFLKDIAEVGGGTYYSFTNNTYVDKLYSNYSKKIVPILNKAVHVICDASYPSEPTQDTTPGQTGVDVIITGPVPPPPIPPGPFLPAGIDIPPSPEEDAKFIIGGGGGGGGGGGSSGRTTSEPGCFSPNKFPINKSASPVSFETQPVYRFRNGKCRCITPGIATMKATLTNINCAENSLYIDAVLKIKTLDGYNLKYILDGGYQKIPKNETKEITLRGKACGPVKGEYMEVFFAGARQQTIWGTYDCPCICPSDMKPPLKPEYDLKKCPNDIVTIFAWDCENYLEAKNKHGNHLHNCQKCAGNGGCTWDAAPNYDPEASFDDGSCITCFNQGLCRYGDDCKGGDCNSVGNGCCDEGCAPCNGTPDDCSPTRNNSAVKYDFEGNPVVYWGC